MDLLPDWYLDWFCSLKPGALLWYLGLTFVAGGVAHWLIGRMLDRFFGNPTEWID